MERFTQSQLKRLTAVHGWSGTVLGLLLYVVVLTGTVVVFAHEMEVWSIGGVRHHVAPISGEIDAKVRPIIESVTKGYQKDVNIGGNAYGDLVVFPHAEVIHPETGEEEPYGSRFRLDAATGEILERQDGFVFDEPRNYVESALESFLVGLHVRLYVPRPWGYILTGVLGLLMISTGISGLILHRHMIRDLFVSTRPGKRLVTFRDRHVLAGTWGLVFAFLLGFTGAYFSFAGTVVYPLLVEAAFGGDRDKASAALFAPAVQPDPTPVPLANLDALVADAAERAGSPVTGMSIENYGRRDAIVRTFHAPASGGMDFVRMVYDGATGAHMYTRPNIGREPSSASAVRGLMWPLHTGDFAGALSKSVWVGLGSAMAFVVISGLRLWVRRREDERLWRRFGRAVTVTGYGLPVAISVCAYGYFLALGAGADTLWWTPVSFMLGIVLGILPGFASREDIALRRFYRLVIGAGALLLPVLRMAMGGLDWAGAIQQGQGEVLSIDLMLIALGAGMLWWARRPRAAAVPQPVPAE